VTFDLTEQLRWWPACATRTKRNHHLADRLPFSVMHLIHRRSMNLSLDDGVVTWMASGSTSD
jgi:hypothetical protein